MDRIKIAVIIRGGVVQSIRSNYPKDNVDIVIFDFDEAEEYGELSEAEKAHQQLLSDFPCEVF